MADRRWILADAFFLTRPTLVLVAWIFLLAGAQPLFVAGNDGPFFNLLLLLLQYSCVLGSAFIINQLHDLDGDRINGKCEILTRGYLSESFALGLAWALFALGILIALALGVGNVILTLVFYLLTAIVYNKPPLATKDHPLFGPLTLVLGSLVLVIQGAALGGWEFFWFGLLGILPITVAGLSITLLTTIPDISGDTAVGKKTFAVSYGVDRTWLTSVVLMLLAVVLAVVTHDWLIFWPAAAATGVILYGMLSAPGGERAGFAARWSIFLMALTLVPTFRFFGVVMLIFFLGAREYHKRRLDLCYPSLGLDDCGCSRQSPPSGPGPGADPAQAERETAKDA